MRRRNLKPLAQGRDAGMCFRITLGEAQPEADPPHSFGLLRARRCRPQDGATEKRNEIAALHAPSQQPEAA
jgi:hypothetical protein